MEKEQVLEKSRKQKVYVGELERTKTGKGNWISIIIAGVVAVAFIIAECCQGNFTGGWAIGCVCYTWASVLYFCQFFLAKRPWQVLIGAVLHGLAAITMIVLYVLFSCGILD